MARIISIVTAFLACLLGKICGLGGGVIIKPVLDALEVASISAINFMSGCTLIGMSAWSIAKSYIKKESQIDLKTSTPLGLGAAIGGILGKTVFNKVSSIFPNTDTVGGVQAILLLLATAGTLLYTVNKSKIKTKHITNLFACFAVGLCLGAFSLFLGVGGGPFNMVVLFYFFSMETKVAAQNSIYMIFISQITGILKTVLSGTLPTVIPLLLLGMILAGILGSEIGGRLNKRLSNSQVTKLFAMSMILVMAICVYNVIKYFK